MSQPLPGEQHQQQHPQQKQRARNVDPPTTTRPPPPLPSKSGRICLSGGTSTDSVEPQDARVVSEGDSISGSSALKEFQDDFEGDPQFANSTKISTNMLLHYGKEALCLLAILVTTIASYQG